jgi:RNA polymerase sigma-54 factor
MVNDFTFSFNITTTKEELERLLRVIHQFDPPGVGARNLQECLLIQLNRTEDESFAILLARKIIEHYFDEFSKKHYDRIMKRANVDEDALKEAIDEILKLNPKPGNSLSDSSRGGMYIVPDFFISSQDGDLELRINSRNTPELRINRTYREMLEHFAAQKGQRSTSQDKEALLFVKQKIDSAKWFIDAINQREQTLYITMSAIMAYQSEYFLTGDETNLKPMILKDIAEIVNLDISTISRVASSKYVQTPFGTFLLKSFFSEGMQTESGEEVSSREVKKILDDCIGSEDKRSPLTDDALAVILKEKGYTIARRTVAKYREQLGIPVARMRKEL